MEPHAPPPSASAASVAIVALHKGTVNGEPPSGTLVDHPASHSHVHMPAQTIDPWAHTWPTFGVNDAPSEAVGVTDAPTDAVGVTAAA